MRSHRVSPTNHPWPPLTVCHARVPARRFVGFGLALTIGYTAVLSIFYFGLYEAGKTTEAPLKAVMAMIPMDEIGYVLSDDLSSLVDDDDVPVFLPRP